MDVICRMHERDRCGELIGTAIELAEMTRCNPTQFMDAARDLKANAAAEVRFNGTEFFLRNRRMYLADQKRKSNAKRQLKHREKQKENTVTDFDILFERFWQAFPSSRKHGKAGARESFRKAIAKTDAETIITSASEYAASEVARGKYVKMPETWLNKECWSDDREAWRDLDNKQAPKTVEYRRIAPAQFKAFRDGKEFFSGPYADPVSATGHRRYFGQLKNGSRVETVVVAKVEAQS